MAHRLCRYSLAILAELGVNSGWIASQFSLFWGAIQAGLQPNMAYIVQGVTIPFLRTAFPYA
jgi:hypothetical protein